jgi:hypothetical protein
MKMTLKDLQNFINTCLADECYAEDTELRFAVLTKAEEDYDCFQSGFYLDHERSTPKNQDYSDVITVYLLHDEIDNYLGEGV